MKVGVIGVGYWGKKHVEEYCNLGHTVIVSDLNQKNLEYCKNIHGTQIVKDYSEILEDKLIECVSICTPNSTHHDLSIAALNRGKNVLVEKPISTNTKDAEEIIQVAKKTNLILLIGHIYRFNNAIEKIKQLVQEENLGKIYTVNLEWTNYEPIFGDRDVLFDLGVHPIDIIDNIFEGEYGDMFCRARGFRQKHPEFAILNYTIRSSITNSSIPINIALSWINPIKRRILTIVGSKKTATVNCTEQKITQIDNISKMEEIVEVIPNNTLQDELDFFIKSCQNKKQIVSPKPSGEIGRKIIEIIAKAEVVKHD